MNCQRIYLNEEKNVYFDTYLISNSTELHRDKKRPLIVICPGGGYKNLSDREAEPIALKYVSFGYHAVVLRYSVDIYATMPGPILDLAKTMIYIKENADNWYVDENNIFTCGFSAGGHLVASLGVFHNDLEVLGEFKGKEELIKPKGMILGYPVIDLKSTATKLDIGIEGYPDYSDIDFDMLYPNMDPASIYIRENNKTYVNFEVAMNAYMFGGNITEKLIQKYSVHTQVDENTPPAFLWHGGYDNLILPKNSLKFASALIENNIECELHIFRSGGHGLSLCNEITANNSWELSKECEIWFDMSIQWIKGISDNN